MEQNFEGKSVIVTGSSKGMGETMAVLFAKRGASVTVCGRDPERLEAVLALCREASPDGKNKCISVCGDITDDLVQTETVNRTVEAFGRLDVLVVNHGIISQVSDTAAITSEDFDSLINTNLKSAFFLIQKAVPHLEQTQGKIVTISSFVSTRVVPVSIIYSISKTALDHMTRILALELAAKGIRVNSVNPGLTETSMAASVVGEDMTEIHKMHPLHDRMAKPEDIARVVAFLASESASFVTGECITVDGAFSLQTLPA